MLLHFDDLLTSSSQFSVHMTMTGLETAGR